MKILYVITQPILAIILVLLFWIIPKDKIRVIAKNIKLILESM